MTILVGGLLGSLAILLYAYGTNDSRYLSYAHGLVVASVMYIFLFSVFGD